MGSGSVRSSHPTVSDYTLRQRFPNIQQSRFLTACIGTSWCETCRVIQQQYWMKEFFGVKTYSDPHTYFQGSGPPPPNCFQELCPCVWYIPYCLHGLYLNLFFCSVFVVFSFPVFVFFLVSCYKLIWFYVRFWVHIKIARRIALYLGPKIRKRDVNRLKQNSSNCTDPSLWLQATPHSSSLWGEKQM